MHVVREHWAWITLSAVTLALGITWTLAARVPAAATTNDEPPPGSREGFSAPDFAVDQLGGGQVHLADLRGKVVLVNLWATWCPPCRAEMPAIESVYQAFQSRGLVVLAVDQTNQDTEEAAAAFASNLGLTFLIALDRKGEVGALYSLQGLPSSYFIDRKGVIRSVVVGGPMNAALIQSKIEALIKE